VSLAKPLTVVRLTRSGRLIDTFAFRVAIIPRYRSTKPLPRRLGGLCATERFSIRYGRRAGGRSFLWVGLSRDTAAAYYPMTCLVSRPISRSIYRWIFIHRRNRKTGLTNLSLSHVIFKMTSTAASPRGCTPSTVAFRFTGLLSGTVVIVWLLKSNIMVPETLAEYDPK